MPRALHVLGSLNPGGVERWLLDTVRLRGDSPWRFDFCLLGAGRGAYAPLLEALGCRLLHCPLLPRITFPARLFALLRRQRYEAVHSHVHQCSGLVLAAARAAGVPVRAAHSHTWEPLAALPLQRRLYGRAMRVLLDKTMTLGFACSQRAAALGGERLLPRFQIVRCGIDLQALQSARPDRNRLRAQLGVPLDAPVVGHVGRLAAEKNQAFLLRVLARLVSRVPLARLVIVGGGCLRGELEGLACRLGLRQRVVFTGPRDDVYELLTIFDAFALPSLREGLPVAALEAQAAGLPCVVSEQTPGEAVVLPERVEQVPLRLGTAAWAAALERAVAAPRGDPSAACRRLRERGFDVAASFGLLTRAYDELVCAASRRAEADPPARWSLPDQDCAEQRVPDKPAAAPPGTGAV
jgi:glycosyltransferase involved in cell wall biosynthesis